MLQRWHSNALAATEPLRHMDIFSSGVCNSLLHFCFGSFTFSSSGARPEQCKAKCRRIVWIAKEIRMDRLKVAESRV